MKNSPLNALMFTKHLILPKILLDKSSIAQIKTFLTVSINFRSTETAGSCRYRFLDAKVIRSHVNALTYGVFLSDVHASLSLSDFARAP